jgi:hypothetical protein
MQTHHFSEIFLLCALLHAFFWVAQDGAKVIARI